MATLTVTQKPPQGSGFALTVTITYTTSTSGATHTLTVTNVACTWTQASPSWAFTEYTIKLGNTTLASNVTINAGSSNSVNYVATTTMTHTAQAKALTLSLGKGEIHYYWPVSGGYNVSVYEAPAASNSANVSISARPSYAVSYNNNGGSGNPPSAQVKWHDETLKLTESKPSRANYVFWHWNTSSNNSGTAYDSGANYTSNAALTLYAIWNPIIAYNGNGGSNVPAQQTKTYGTNLTLSTTIPTRVGYKFLSWNTNADGTGTTYQPGGTYTSNTATTLYAIWQRVAQAPTISSIKVVRCTSSGTESDSGTYCKLTAQWSVDTASEAGMSANQGTVAGTIKANGSSTTRSITFSGGTSGTRGTATAIVPNCDTDTQYLVTVTVTNTVIGAGNTNLLSTSRSDILTMAFFTMDFASGGRGIGIGTAAPTEGIELGLPVQFDDDVTMLGNLVAPNLTLASETGSAVASASSGSSWGITDGSTYGYRYGPFSMVSICAKSTTALVAGTQYTVASVTSKYRPIRDVGFANQYGHGVITSGGTVYFRPTVAVGANTSMYVGATCVAGS